MDARAGPLGEDAAFRQRLERADVGAGGEMEMRRLHARRLKPVFPPEQNRRVLGMDGAALAEPGENLEPLEHGAVRRTGKIAGGVAEEQLEADRPGRSERFELIEIMLAEHAIDTEIAVRLGSGEAELEIVMFDRIDRRVGVRHLEHRRHPAHHGGGRTGLPVLLFLHARLAEMNMDVDDAGQHVQARRVEPFDRRRHVGSRADGGDTAVTDRDAGLEGQRLGDNGAVFDDEVGGPVHAKTPYIR